MRTSLCCYFLFLYLNTSIGQEIIYKPVFINQCGYYEDNSIFWLLHDSTQIYNLEDFNRTQVKLPRLGVYFLELESNKTLIQIEINSYGTKHDTFLTKKIELVQYISNPPHSEFFDCDSLVNGFAIDKYYNGNIRLEGHFEQGQPIDTLKRYYRSGIIQSIYVSNKKCRQYLDYYKNGQIQSDYHINKRYHKTYYKNGQIQKNKTWNKRFHESELEYFENGSLKTSSSPSKKLIFSENGMLIKKHCRKKNFFMNIGRKVSLWGNYTWEIFDSLGNRTAEIEYNNSSDEYLNGFYLDSIRQIDYDRFTKVLTYSENKKVYKMEIDYVKEKDKYVRKLLLYKWEKNQWKEIKKVPDTEIFSTLEFIGLLRQN